MGSGLGRAASGRGDGRDDPGQLVQMGEHKIDRANWDWDEVDRNPFFCPDAARAAFYADYLDRVRKAGSKLTDLSRIPGARRHNSRRRMAITGTLRIQSPFPLASGIRIRISPNRRVWPLAGSTSGTT